MVKIYDMDRGDSSTAHYQQEDRLLGELCGSRTDHIPTFTSAHNRLKVVVEVPTFVSSDGRETLDAVFRFHDGELEIILPVNPQSASLYGQ